MGEVSFQWGAVWPYHDAILTALLTSIRLTGAVLVLGGLLGLALAYASASSSWPVRLSAILYVDAARNTPLLIFIFLLYLVAPELGFPAFANETTFIIALTVTASGAICENFRAAFASMPKTYIEAAMAVGLRDWQRQLYVVLPVAIRFALPALTNSAVAAFKDSSIASIIAVRELTFIAREISTNTFRVFEAWLLIAALYLAATALMGAVGRSFERRLTPGS